MLNWKQRKIVESSAMTYNKRSLLRVWPPELPKNSPYVKLGRRESAKRCSCLFTCVTSRGVHLEILNSMDTDDFIM